MRLLVAALSGAIMATSFNHPASSSSSTLFAAVALMVVVLFVIAAPGVFTAGSAQPDVLLVGP